MLSRWYREHLGIGASPEGPDDDETYPYGRFAQLADPEGNAVQLWQPP